jgi:TolB-like protein
MPGFVGRLKHLRGSISGLVGRLKRLRGPIVAIAAVGAVLSGLFGYWNVYRSVNDSPGPPKSPPAAGAPLLSIAVLPFTVVGGKTVDESLAQSVTHDVTSALARSARWALVASYGSVANYKGKSPDASTAGRDLNVGYLVEGDIRQDGDRVVLGVRMIDARTARELWNDQLETTTSQLNTNAPAGLLANRIKATLFVSEVHRVSQQPGTTANSADLCLRGEAAGYGTLNGAREALKLYDKSLQLDAKSTCALISRTYINSALLELEPHADRDRLVREMDDFSLRAVATDRNDPNTWTARAHALARQYRWNEALEAMDEALRIDPYRSWVYTDRALFKIWMGRPQEALAELDKSVALDAREAVEADTMRIGCRAHLALGHYEDAIKLCERASALDDLYQPYLYLTAAYAQTGKMAKASTAKVQLLRLQPGYTIERYRKLRVSDVPEFWQQTEVHMFAGLRKAGVPEK